MPFQQDEIDVLKFQELSVDAEEVYIFEVNLHYQTRVHNPHDDYPLAPMSLLMDRDMYSSTHQAVFPESAPQRKLTPSLWDKVLEVVHYRTLKLYLQLDHVVTKVHRVLRFKQSAWLKIYIDINSLQRSLAGEFCKLMNNSVFEKTQEILRNRVNVELVTDARIPVTKPKFLQSQPHY